MRGPRLLAALAMVVALCASGSAHALGLDPFRSGATPSTTTGLNPFRTAQTAPAPDPAAAPPPKRAVATPLSCTRDEDCADDSICENAVCAAIPQRTNILYLYYREGSFFEVMGLYWSKRGASGFRVLAPFYWHFWTPTSRTRVVAPFYWRFEDYAQQHFTTVIVPGLPVSWSSEPGGSSWAVWPLVYSSTKYGWALPLLGTGALRDPAQQSSFGAVAFLYWWKRAPDHSFDLAFPLFVSSRSKAKAFTFALPLTFYWRNQDDATTLAIPFFYRNSHKTGGSFYSWVGYRTREGKDTTGSLFWLYWYGRNDANRTAYDIGFPLIWSFRGPRRSSTVAFPLVWHFREGESTDTVVFPLFWRFASPDASTTLLLPFIHARRNNWTMNALFPVWWSGGDPQAGYAFRTLLPLFYWQNSEHDRRETWFSLIGGYHRNDDTQSRTLAVLPGIILHRDPVKQFQVVTPLFIRHHNSVLDSTTRLLGLLLYLRNDPQGSTSVLFPLFWRFHDAPTDASATMFFPFFAHRSGPRDTTFMAGVFPLWLYGRSFTDGGWSGGLFPLAYFGRRGDDSHAVVFPLLWHFGHRDSSTTVALPLFYRHADRHGTETGLLPLLTFFGNSDGDSYAVQFPLFWRFTSQRQGWATTVTPLGFFHSGRDGWSLGVGPVIPLLFAGGGGDRSHFALVPLIWHFADRRQDKTTTVVGPYLHRRHGGETTDALFPLLHYRRGARPGGDDQTSFTLFPLVHYRRDAASSVLATPLGLSYRSQKRDVGFVGPFFWFRNSELAAKTLFPLFADVTHLRTGERLRQYGLWFQLDTPDSHSQLLFPLYGHHEDRGETDTWVFPSFFRQRRADGYHVDALVPFYWHSGGEGFATTVIGPWYNRTAPGVHNTGVAPLWFYARNDQRSITVVPPLLLYRRRGFQDDTTRLWAGPVFHSRDQDVRHRTVVFPLWWSGHEKERSHAMLMPFYWHFANSRDDASWTLLGPVYWASHGQERTRGILPLAWYSSDPANDSGSVAVAPLFYRSHGPGRSAFMTLLGGFSRTPTSNLWYAGPVLSSDKIESSFSMVAPLWFRHTNKASETVTQVIPPLLSVSRTNPEGGLTTFLALFWRYRDIASSTTIGFPLFYDFHDYHQSRFTLFLPLLARYERHSDQNTYWVAPLFYRHSTPTDATTVAFPLWWDFKRGDNRTTVFFPFYAHWKRPSYQSTYIFPTYYYREGLRTNGDPDGTWLRVVAPFYRSAVYRPGDSMWEVLGGLFGQERIGRKRFLKIVFMRFETEAPTHAQTSWYSTPVRQSRRAPVRGLASASSAW